MADLALDIAIITDHPAAADICRARLDALQIPRALHDGLVRYLVQRIRPGGFLTAVLENDLREAVARANPPAHLLALPALAKFLYNEAPAAAHGDPASVNSWIAERRPFRTPTSR